jgi:hypothetical protein
MRRYPIPYVNPPVGSTVGSTTILPPLDYDAQAGCPAALAGGHHRDERAPAQAWPAPGRPSLFKNGGQP